MHPHLYLVCTAWTGLQSCEELEHGTQQEAERGGTEHS